MKLGEIYSGWIASLRSGKYGQGTHYLRYHNRDEGCEEFCCLGVLTDVISRTKCRVIAGSEAIIGGFGWTVPNSHEIYRTTIPENTCETLGLGPLHNETTETWAGILIKMNDFDLKSFDDIADYIEKNILPTIDKEKEIG